MQIAIAGASGLIGRALARRLDAEGHRVVRLVRRAPRSAEEVRFDAAAGGLDAEGLAGSDAAVILSGVSIAGGRWTAARRREIRASRVESTELLARTLAKLEPRPRVLVAASAIGFYGDRGGERLDEASAPGEGFLADLCREWEAAAEPARAAGVRTVSLRSGLVLAREGGTLRALLVPFRLGLGGVVGGGGQYMSWISLEDEVRAVEHCLHEESLEGPVNAVAPEPVTNAEFTRTLARALRRPALLPVPAFAARLLLGQMADELLLASARVHPVRLAQTGFAFRHPTLAAALDAIL